MAQVLEAKGFDCFTDDDAPPSAPSLLCGTPTDPQVVVTLRGTEANADDLTEVELLGDASVLDDDTSRAAFVSALAGIDVLSPGAGDFASRLIGERTAAGFDETQNFGEARLRARMLPDDGPLIVTLTSRPTTS